MKKRYDIVFMLLIWAICFKAQAKPNPEDLMDKDWLEARSPNFHIITDAKEEIALKMAQDLENFRFIVSKMLKADLVEGLPPVKILAVYHKSNLDDLALRGDMAGVFLQTLDGAYAIAGIPRYELDSDETNWGKRVLMHEYVHYVQRNTFSQFFYPLWYQEGMAEYFSTFKYENKAISFGSSEAINSRAYLLDHKSGKFSGIGVENLLKTRRINRGEARKDKEEVGRFYAKATVLVHYLNSSDENQRLMQNYIAMVNQGYDIDSAFKKSFSRSFQDLDNEVANYINGDKLVMRQLIPGAGFSFPVFSIKVNPLSSVDSHYYIADFLMRSYYTNKIGGEQIVGLIEKDLKADPDNIEKKILMADMFYMDGKLDESRRVLNEVLEKNPMHLRALTLNADIQYAQALLDRQVGQSGWEQTLDKARNQYRKAIKLNPMNGRAYSGLGMSYLLKTDSQTLNEAFVALDSARFFSPDRELPWYEALLRLRIHDNENAIPLLRRYVNMDEGPQFSIARSLLDMQELRLLTKMPAENPSAGWHLYADGSSYEGGWKQGMPEGKGTLARPNGVKYTGSWKSGLIDGAGVFLSSNGRKYSMQFTNGEATGTGELNFPDVSYKGELLNGIAHGKGEWDYLKDGKLAGKYAGQFWYSQRNGPGVIYSEDGTSTPTDWIFDKCKIQLSEELIYVGDVNNKGKPHGWGRCVNRKNSNKVEWCRYSDGVPSPVQASEQTE